MKDITIDHISAVNLIALDAALRTALGSSVFGLTHNGQSITVHLADDAPPGKVAQTRTIVQSHDPSQLTPDQQAGILKQAKLEQARQDFAATELDLKTYEGKDALLEALAKKVSWLEREINALRNVT